MTLSEQAEFRIRQARTQLLFSDPFFGLPSLHVELAETDNPRVWCMGTDGVTLFYNAKGVLSLSMDETKGVVCHEVGHIMLDHMNRMGNRELIRWNYACLSFGTRISMADGSRVAIESILPGDMVHSPLGPNRVLGVVYSGVKTCLELNHQSGILYSTPDHRILTTKGWINAEQTTDETQGFIEGESRGRKIHPQALQADALERVERGYQGSVLQHSAVPIQPRPSCFSDDYQTLEPSSNQRYAPYGSRLSCGDYRWGGHCLCTGSHKEEGLLSSIHRHYQHVLSASPVAKAQRILRGGIREQRRESLLRDILVWLPDGRVALIDPSLFGYKGSACRSAHGIDPNTPSPEVQRQPDRTDARDCFGAKDFECTRISIGPGSGQERPVYDLVTERQVIVAEGIVVHNCDYPVNWIVTQAGLSLPKGSLMDQKFGQMNAEAVYPLLPQQQQGGGGKGGKQGGQGQQQSQQQNQPGNGQGDPSDFGAILEPPPGTNKEQLKKDWEQIVQQAAQVARQAGKLPAGLERLVEEMRRAKVNWRELLRRWLEEQIVTDFRWSRPNRKFISQGIYLPSTYKEGCGVLVFAGDRSGSINQGESIQCVSEMRTIQDDLKPSELWCLSFDTAIYNAQCFRPGEPFEWQPKGGGGTDFRPVFDWVEQQGIRPKALIMFTDMYGSFPAEPPPYNVLWICTTDQVAPFGETVRIEV